MFDPVKKIYRRPSKYSLAGVSDIIGIHPKTGQLIALEVKNAKGKASMEQIAFIERIKKNNGIAGIVRSIDDVEELLNGTI